MCAVKNSIIDKVRGSRRNARVKLNAWKTVSIEGTDRKVKVDADVAHYLRDKELIGIKGYPHFRICFRQDVDGYNARAYADIPLHRFVMKAKPSEYVDHKNLDLDDCRRSELRICSHAQNLLNRGKSKNNTSGFKGVISNRGKSFTATASKDRRIYQFGTYSTLEVAARVYDREVLKLHGEFARLNFEEDREIAAAYVAPKNSDISRKESAYGTGVYAGPNKTFYCQVRVNGKAKTVGSGFRTPEAARTHRAEFLANL